MIASLYGSSPLPKELFGGKGAGLWEMAQLGIPVPPGFVLSTEVQISPDDDKLSQDVIQALEHLEQITGCKLGDPQHPLFVSVRSGAPISMPGMMDTFINLGLNDQTFPALVQRLQSEQAASLSYIRFLYTYGKLIFNLPWPEHFHSLREYKDFFHKMIGQSWSQDIYTHLFQAIKAVKASWNSPRAIAYRTQQGMGHQGGTAIIVQTMVFGNHLVDSGTGVLFTRNPSTGVPQLFGEYMPSAQGEDLVSGTATPHPLTSLKASLPKVYDQLSTIAYQLDQHYGDMQDIEFTIEKGKLWILQTRPGKRTAQAAFKIAYDRLHKECSVQALMSIDPLYVHTLLHPRLASQEGLEKIGKGFAASPGATSGPLTFDLHSVENHSILIRPETCSEEMDIMMKARGVITLTGGMTSHAAVVMRSLGKPCITALEDAQLHEEFLIIGSHQLYPGEYVTIDGTTGGIFKGQGRLENPILPPEVYRIMARADEVRTLKVWANADTPQDIRTALTWGAEGVGLCRTEHMMFAPSHIDLMHELIMAPTSNQQDQALEKLLPLHQQDFVHLLRELKGKLLTVRLLDPPLHEFLPSHPKNQAKVAQRLGMTVQEFDCRLKELKETNPMLGHRGCRLAVSFPSIYAMQVKALSQAASQCQQEGIPVHLALMVPFVTAIEEIIYLKKLVQNFMSFPCQVGTMVEVPRAALLAGELASHVDFISFGTNDLTQMTWGLSRDDSRFLDSYRSLGIDDPFQVFDERGVGQLMTWACQAARQANPSLKITICGEHGGHPKAINFFHKLGLDGISCSPWRILTARLAGAQAALKTQHT